MADKKEWTEDELLAAARTFKDAMQYIETNAGIWSDIVNECDKAFGDIYHYCELKEYPLTGAEQQQICDLIHDYSQKRRTYKDLLAATEPLLLWYKSVSKSYFQQQINEASKIQAKEATRLYYPRVLHELFQDDDTIEERGELD